MSDDEIRSTWSRGARRRMRLGPAAMGIALVFFSGVIVACQKLPVGPGAPSQLGTFQAHASAEQIWVEGGVPGAQMSVQRGHRTVATGTVDSFGSLLFHQLHPGGGYEVVQKDHGAVTHSPLLHVMSNRPAPPDRSIYNQQLQIDPKTNSGYGYVTTRDGTKIAVMVRLPGPPDKGPYPTVVEYSGYDPANPDSPQPATLISGALGFATVGVNMRGTGCSGGVYDYFEPLQSLDGYDVIETVARQPWVFNHKVGMVGISFPAISQLFVGATDPPHLAAITPLSTIDNTATTLYPGGMLNNGFALSWGLDRVHDSKPATATTGQPWAFKRIQQGDQTCADNQKLRLQTPDLIAKTLANNFYDPAVADPLNPTTFVNRINVPTYLACQWEDEQTGGHCADLAEHFTGTKRKWFTFTNGTHADSLDPATLLRWYDFLELYVAHQTPRLPAVLKALAPALYQQGLGVSGVQLPDDPIQHEPDYAHALAAFNALPQIRVLFDNGNAAGSGPGVPGAAFEQSFKSFPIPGTTAQHWYFGPNGTLTTSRPHTSGADKWVWDPTARPSVDFKGSSTAVWKATPPYNWTPLADGKAAAYVSDPLAQNTTVIGGGSVDLWLQSTATDTDLQVTLSEVRPDGNEVFVQNGWLRASERKLAHGSTELEPQPTGFKSDVQPLPAGQWSEVRVPLYYSGHVFRAGSRIRVSVEAPGGDQPFWAFLTLQPQGTVVNTIARTPVHASNLVLPVVSGVNVPTGLPPCPGLRGEPCRTYVPFTNTPAS